jgi:peptidoglycan hydrolase CwlO-like protein
MDVEKEITDIKDDVQDLQRDVRDLMYWRDVLNRDMQELKSTFQRFDEKLERTLERQVKIVEDAAARVPKWVMWLVGSVGIVIAGWFAYHH